MQKEVEGCTFAPKTLKYHHGVKVNNHGTHGDKCKDLYSLKSKGWFKQRGHKTSDDYEFERS